MLQVDVIPINTCADGLVPQSAAPYLLHELAIFVSCIVKPHTPVAIISLPKMHNERLIVVFAALKGKYTAFLVLHFLFGIRDNLYNHIN